MRRHRHSDSESARLSPILLLLPLSALSRLHALTTSTAHELPITSYLFPPASRYRLGAHLASLITGRPRRDRALSYGADKADRLGYPRSSG
jgi:hypothetical protein